MTPSAVLSTHLPPVLDGSDVLLGNLRLAPTAAHAPAPTSERWRSCSPGFAPG